MGVDLKDIYSPLVQMSSLDYYPMGGPTRLSGLADSDEFPPSASPYYGGAGARRLAAPPGYVRCRFCRYTFCASEAGS